MKLGALGPLLGVLFFAAPGQTLAQPAREDARQYWEGREQRMEERLQTHIARAPKDDQRAVFGVLSLISVAFFADFSGDLRGVGEVQNTSSLTLNFARVHFAFFNGPTLVGTDDTFTAGASTARLTASGIYTDRLLPGEVGFFNLFTSIPANAVTAYQFTSEAETFPMVSAVADLALAGRPALSPNVLGGTDMSGTVQNTGSAHAYFVSVHTVGSLNGQINDVGFTFVNGSTVITCSGISTDTGLAQGAEAPFTDFFLRPVDSITRVAFEWDEFSISPGAQAFGAAGGAGSITVAHRCGWTAISNASWITITSGAVGNRDGTIAFSVAPNSGAARSGTITVAGVLTFTVNQAGAGLPPPPPPPVLPPPGPLPGPAQMFMGKEPLDLNGDGLGDAFLANILTGAWSRETNNGAGGFTRQLGMWDPGWQIYALRLNADAATDFFLYDPVRGLWITALNDGLGDFTYTTGAFDSAWRIYPADLNGDGRTDIFVYNFATGVWVKCFSTGLGTFTFFSGNWDPAWEFFTADMNGDGRDDFFLYNRTNGVWAQAFSRSGFDAFDYVVGQWDPSWEVHPADLNGDGREDLFLINPAGVWVWALSRPGGDFDYTVGQWSSGWSVTTADLNGDGRTDIFLHNPTTGQWFRCLSTGANEFTYFAGSWAPGWSVQATDLNGDGQADLLLSRPDGSWAQAVTSGPGTFSLTSGAWGAGWEVFATRR